MLPPGCDNTPNDPLHDDRLCIYLVGRGHARNPIFVRAFGAHSMVEAGTVILPADALPPLASGVGDATYKIQYEHPFADPALFDNVNNMNVTGLKRPKIPVMGCRADLSKILGYTFASVPPPRPEQPNTTVR